MLKVGSLRSADPHSSSLKFVGTEMIFKVWFCAEPEEPRLISSHLSTDKQGCSLMMIFSILPMRAENQANKA